jgi:hypothetical protein
MAVLPKETQEAMRNVDDGGTGEFAALPEGYYLARVDSCRTQESKRQPKPGETIYPYERITFKVIEPTSNKNRLVSENYSFSPAAAFKLRELFDAAELTEDSDTQELKGEVLVIEVEQEEITTGARKGEMGNNVAKVHPADGEHRDLVTP